MLVRALALWVFAASVQAQAPARVEALAWMSGAWVEDTPKGRVAETWLGPGNGVMVAVNLSTFAGGRKSFEFLRIADTADGVTYFASPGGRPATEFRLKELGEQRVVFENAGHDFPQRILYWREGEALVARIEGSIQGRSRSQQWRFARER
jgi:hypothetical protein